MTQEKPKAEMDIVFHYPASVGTGRNPASANIAGLKLYEHDRDPTYSSSRGVLELRPIIQRGGHESKNNYLEIPYESLPALLQKIQTIMVEKKMVRAFMTCPRCGRTYGLWVDGDDRRDADGSPWTGTGYADTAEKEFDESDVAENYGERICIECYNELGGRLNHV